MTTPHPSFGKGTSPAQQRRQHIVGLRQRIARAKEEVRYWTVRGMPPLPEAEAARNKVADLREQLRRAVEDAEHYVAEVARLDRD